VSGAVARGVVNGSGMGERFRLLSETEPMLVAEDAEDAGNANPFALETDRLRLMPLQTARAAELAEVYADRKVARYIGADGLSAEGTRDQITLFEQVWRERGYGQSAVIEKASGRMIGRAGLHYWPVWDEVELGYVIARAWQGKGLAREAAQAWVEWAFEHLPQDHLIAVINPENVASIALAERLGFVFDRHDRTPREVDVSIYRLDAP
jgi:RimJ/RimL family protein N-acetyltransferase